MKNAVTILAITFIFFALQVQAYASFTLPSPPYPTDWDSNSVCSGGSYRCLSGYVYHLANDPLNGYPTNWIWLHRLVCQTGHDPWEVPTINTLYYDGFWSQLVLYDYGVASPICSWQYLGWHFIPGTGWSGATGGDSFTYPSLAFGDSWYSNVDFTFNDAHNWGTDYGNLGSVAVGDILYGQTGTVSAALNSGVGISQSCNDLDIICKGSKALAQLFIPNTQTLHADINSLYASINAKAPFAYISSALATDFSNVSTSSAVPTFNIPITHTSSVSADLPSVMSWSDSSQQNIVKNLASSMVTMFSIGLWITFIFYLVTRIRHIL